MIMFGLDSRLKDRIRIEPKAVIEGNNRKTIYDIGNFVEAFESNGLQVTIARRATSYLCNYAYYRVLEIMGGRATFVHIPSEQNLTDEMKANIHSAIRTSIV